MLANPTLQKLNELKLTGMASAFCDQLSQPLSDLDFETRFGLLVEQEWATRDNRRLMRLIKQAKKRIVIGILLIVFLTASHLINNYG